VIKVASSYFGARSKFFKALLNFRYSAKNYKKFWSSAKKTVNLVPKLKETFDLVKRSSEIRSSDQLPNKWAGMQIPNSI